MKITKLTFIALCILLFSCVPTEYEETIVKEKETHEETDPNLGTFNGKVQIQFYSLFGVPEEYYDTDCSIKVSNHFSNNDYYSVYMDFSGLGSRTFNFSKSTKKLILWSGSDEKDNGSISISSTFCNGNMTYYYSGTDQISSTYNWESYR